MAESEGPNYESGECSQCNSEYVDLRKHWSLSSSCSTPEGRGTYATVECPTCGEEHEKERYELEDNERSFCSTECRDEGIKSGKEVECAQCGDLVYKPACHLDEAGGYDIDNHFCDKECEQAFKRENWRGEEHPCWNGGGVELECGTCGDAFVVKPAKKDTASFCSRECVPHHKYGPEGTQQSVDEVEYECGWCDDPVWRKPYNKKGANTFCSPECFTKWQSEEKRGHGNPAWKGGKSGINAVRRMLGERSWNAHAREARRNAGHVCESCGRFQPHRELSAHHIVPVASGGTHGKWNLMALCENCHGQADAFIREYTEPHLLKFVDE